MSEDERLRKAKSTFWTKKVLLAWSDLDPEDVLLDTPFTYPPFDTATNHLRVALNQEFSENSPGFRPIGSQEWGQKIKQKPLAQANQASRIRDIRDLYHAHR